MTRALNWTLKSSPKPGDHEDGAAVTPFLSDLFVGHFNKERVAFNDLIQETSQHPRALILNSSFQPVTLVTWQKALTLWFQGKVEILEYYDHEVRSASDSFALPCVMRLTHYVAPRRATRLRFSRENIYLRDNHTCQYCGKRFPSKELTLDHVVPASKFGRKDWTNMVTACRKCNHRKANRTPLGAGMPLLSEPRIPTWLPVVLPDLRSDDMPDEWRLYLGTG